MLELRLRYGLDDQEGVSQDRIDMDNRAMVHVGLDPGILVHMMELGYTRANRPCEKIFEDL